MNNMIGRLFNSIRLFIIVFALLFNFGCNVMNNPFLGSRLIGEKVKVKKKEKEKDDGEVSSGWGQQSYIKAINNDVDDFFGASIAISGDTIVVGAFGEASNQTTITNGTTASDDDSNHSSGAVYGYYYKK